jgi:hypothetical protein
MSPEHTSSICPDCPAGVTGQPSVADQWLAEHPDALGLSYGYVLFVVRAPAHDNGAVTSPEEARRELTAATERLLDGLDGLSDVQVAGPSLLPGWTRGHVLTHLARNAEGGTSRAE